MSRCELVHRVPQHLPNSQTERFSLRSFLITACVLQSTFVHLNWGSRLTKLPAILRFPEVEQEREFLRHDCVSNTKWARFCYASGAVLWAAFGLLDTVVAPEAATQLAIVRYFVGLPVLFIAFISTFFPPWQIRLKETGLAVTLICGASIIAMVNLLPTTSTHGYFVGLILVLIYAFSFGQLTFRYAIFAGVFLSFLFIYIELFRLRFPLDVTVSKSAFLLAAVYIGLFSCGILEHHRRNAFVYTKDMRNANEKLVKLADELQKESTHDELTGLLNRRQLNLLFEELVLLLKQKHQPSSLILIDLDNFKKVNDVSGHWTGDRVLKEISNLFTSIVPLKDHIVRLGGDEFVIFAPGFSLSQCENLAKKISSSFSQWKNTNLTARVAGLGLSFGLAEINSEIDSLENALKRADRALYSAKHRSKGGLISNLTRV